MPINKKALLRYRIIDSLLRSPKRRTAVEMHERVNDELRSRGYKQVDIRTIYNDFKSMEELYPVEISREGGQLSYSDKLQSINAINLSTEEKEALELALHTFSMFSGSRLLDKYEDIASSILSKTILRKISDNATSKVIQIGESKSDSGLLWLDTIYSAITEQRALDIQYKSYQSSAEKRLFCPYALKEYRNEWYVVGHHRSANDNGSIRVLKLARMEEVENSAEAFVDDPDFNLEEYFTHSIGVWRSPDGKPIEVVLKFSKDISKLIKESPPHKTMRIIEENDDSLVIQIRVYDTIELKNLILSYGESVEVIEPREIRFSIIQALAKAVEAYK